MQFSKTAQYAIRTLSYLYRYSEKPHSVNTIHKELNLPYKYITKLMTELVKQGLVKSTRGRDGGFTLEKDASEIMLCDIFEAIGEPLEDDQCILGFEKCNAKNPCALHNKWDEPNQMIQSIFTTATLESLFIDQNLKL
ncbi:Rrf2 family transcriptional regulator [Sulfurimonas sp.]|nr:Rrf2 family transcriptional regulator [Sulfurimonas sp.]